MAVGLVMMLPFDRFFQTHFQLSRLFQPLQRDRNHLQGPLSTSRVGLTTRERVGIKIHQARGSKYNNALSGL